MVAQTQLMSMADLVALYNRMMPDAPVKRFSSLDAARKRVDAILAHTAPKPEPRPTSKPARAPDVPRKGKPSGERFVLAFPDGITTLQKNSTRRKVFEKIQELMGTKAQRVSVAALDAAMDFKTQPHLNKLLSGKHIGIYNEP